MNSKDCNLIVHCLAALALVSAIFAPAVYAEKEDERLTTTHHLKGRILNDQKEPVKGAKVVLTVEDDNSTFTDSSDGKGAFDVSFEKCHYVSFEVVPPRKSGLTRAHFQHLSGEVTKQFLVQLHHGFTVNGRVMGHNAGVKGLSVHVTDASDKDVHGGGFTTTGGNGEFSLLLTPGEKLIEIRNEKYSDLAGSTHQRFTIQGDTQLPDIVIPPLR